MSLIVTLTSTSTRLPVLRHTLLSLLDQSHTPDRIVVCISKEPYLIDRGIDILPDWFQLMLDNGEVEVDWVERKRRGSIGGMLNQTRRSWACLIG